MVAQHPEWGHWPPPPTGVGCQNGGYLNRRQVAAALGFIVSGVAVALFARGVTWGELAGTLANVDVRWVALASAMLLGEFVLRAVRWRVLLRPLGTPARVFDLWMAQVIGAAANTLFPLRAGEIAKPLVAARRTGHGLPAVVATAVMERVYDLFGLVSVLVVMVIVLPEEPETQTDLVQNLKLYGGLFGAAALVAMLVFFALATRRTAARGLFAKIVAIAPAPVRDRFLGLFDGFVAGLGNARDPKGLLQAGGLSVAMWLNGALAIWFLFQAFGMDLPFGAACFTGVAIALTVALPQAPGFLGVFHVAMQQTMLLWGQAQTDADGFAIVFWAVSFVPVTLIGFVALWREGLSWSVLRSAQGGAQGGTQGED
jgi:glycosyltransferase 2 family protein